MVNNGTWNFKVSDIAVDGQATGLCGPEGCIAVPDSAASLVGVPTSVLQVAIMSAKSKVLVFFRV